MCDFGRSRANSGFCSARLFDLDTHHVALPFSVSVPGPRGNFQDAGGGVGGFHLPRPGTEGKEKLVGRVGSLRMECEKAGSD